jgi:hypothetical protein
VQRDLDRGALVKIRVAGIPHAVAMADKRSLPEGRAAGTCGTRLYRATQAIAKAVREQTHGIGERQRDERMSNPVSSSALTTDSQQLAWMANKIHA